MGFLARYDLKSRPLPAGPLLPTPGAQMKGHHTFEYAVVPHEGGWENAYAEAHRFARPLRARRLPEGEAALPPQASLLEVSSPAFVVSALKRAEDGRGVILRLYNTLSEPATCDLRLTEPFDGVELNTMDEQPLEALSPHDGRVHLGARPNQIFTIRFRTGAL